MKLRAMPLFLVVACVLVVAKPALPCTVGRLTTGIGIPMEMVANADLILRVTALEYAAAPQGTLRTTGVPDSKVRFRIEETLKGVYSSKDMVLAGYLTGQDDWNDRPSPYDFVRPGGRAGSCFANSYRQGAQFLLALKRNTNPGLFRSDTELTVNWYALGPVNEQLRSENDPWLLWVREQVTTK